MTQNTSTSTAAYGYQSVLGYSANAGPGFNPENPVYEVDKTAGQQVPSSYGQNVVGYNEPGSIASQGSVISKTLNSVPFVNATAGVHDYIFNSGALPFNFATNIGTMVPSAIIAVPAALGNPNLNWIGTTNLNVDKKK